MTTREHDYAVQVTWTGDRGAGTATQAGYDRSYDVAAAAKPVIPGSSDPAFRGDATRWNPEELLVASLAACHQLWYLSLCAAAGVVVTAYEDRAGGVMTEEADGAGRFRSVTLRPHVTIAAGSDVAAAETLHAKAHAMCFIARSVNFPVACAPTIVREQARAVSRDGIGPTE